MANAATYDYTWTGAVSDDWDNASNWSTALTGSGIPGAGASVFIPPGKPFAPFVLNGESLVGLASIVNDSVITFQDTSSYTDFIVNGHTLLSGPGVLRLNDSPYNRIYSNAGGSVLENQSTIAGSGEVWANGNLSIQNDSGGVIDGTGSSAALLIHNITISNAGTLESTAGTQGLTVHDTTIDNTANANSGQIENLGGVVTLGNNVNIDGGTLTSSAGEAIVSAGVGSSLNGVVTISTGSTLTVANGANLTIDGDVVNNGEIFVDSTGGSYADLIFNDYQGTNTLSGSGTVQLSDSAYNRIYSTSGDTTLDIKQTITGAGEIWSNGNLSVVNDASGVIDASAGNNALLIHDITIDNKNIIEATGAAGLVLHNLTINNNSDGANSGQLQANGGTVQGCSVLT